MALPRVQTCITWNETTQTCDVSAWVEQQPTGLLPPMSLAEGKQIGDALVFALVSVMCVKLFLKPSTHKTR
jgi:hypothetical protein